MQTFPKLQRIFTTKNYLVDVIVAFVIVIFNSSFVYFPLLIGLFITLDFRISFLLTFLFFTEITHNFLFFSLIGFYFVYKHYIHPILQIKISKIYSPFISIPIVYIFYFTTLSAIYTMNDISYNFDYLYILYYILIEELLLSFKEFK
jgi:hypothetical protein